VTKPETANTYSDQANEAEMKLIGSLLIDPTLVHKVQMSVKRSDFLNALAGIAFDAIVNLANAKMAVDPLQVAYVIKSQTSENAMAFLAKCSLEGQASAIDLFVKDVRQLASQRAMREIAAKFIERVQDQHVSGTDDVSEHAAWMQSQLEQIAVNQDGSQLWNLSDAISECLESIRESMNTGGATGVSTGLNAIDECFGGIFPGELTIVAARPGIGKSALVLQIARHVGKTSGTALVFSLEMTRKELASRCLCSVGSVNGQRLRVGLTDPNEYERLMGAAEELGDCKLIIDDRVTRNIDQICAIAKLVATQDKLAAIFVDYIQIVKPTAQFRNSDSKRDHIASVVQNLKWLAKELNVPVMAISMASREGGKAPWLQMHHLAESSSIESDSNSIWFLQNEVQGDSTKYYIDVAKNRGGQVGRRELAWVSKYTRWEDLEVSSMPNYEHQFDEYGS
jgi:replicative DNA helicase